MSVVTMATLSRPSPPHKAPLPTETLLDAEPAAKTLKLPLAPKPKLRAETGTVLKIPASDS